MPAFIKNLTVDCADAMAVARFWAGAEVAPNRVHLDLRSLTSMDEEVERLVGLGATVVERFDDITVMADPEGNEFCVEPGPGDPHPASGR